MESFSWAPSNLPVLLSLGTQEKGDMIQSAHRATFLSVAQCEAGGHNLGVAR